MSRPSGCATAAASPWPATPSLVRIWETWRLAVLGVMNSAWPVWRLVRPAATRARTSVSRWVNATLVGMSGGPAADDLTVEPEVVDGAETVLDVWRCRR